MGHQAVIVFFILSGFLVGNSAWRMIREGRWRWRTYLIQRVTRLGIVLLPALILGFGLDYAGTHYLASSHNIYTAPAGQSMVTTSVGQDLNLKVLAGNALFLQTIYVPVLGTNSALWSLANEYWYYLAFPALLVAIVGSRSILGRLINLGVGVCILVVVGPKIAMLFPIWILGFGVSVTPLLIPHHYRRVAMAAAAVQFIGTNALARIHAFPSLVADALPGVSFALFLYVILHYREPLRWGVYTKLARGFAGFSYTLYAVHLPFVTFMTGLIINPWGPWHKDIRHLLAAGFLVSVAYVYAWLLYLLFERNTASCRRYLSRSLAGGDTPRPAVYPKQVADQA
jgi:peptidoglycan/LPS O-acetylase OafA/YrhL